MSHHHDHLPHGAGTHRGRLAVVLGITATVLVTELVGAWVSGSVALLADAGHEISDEHRVGKECVLRGRSRCAPYP